MKTTQHLHDIARYRENQRIWVLAQNQMPNFAFDTLVKMRVVTQMAFAAGDLVHKAGGNAFSRLLVIPVVGVAHLTRSQLVY